MRWPRDGYRLAEGTDLFDFIGDAYTALRPVQDRLHACAVLHEAVMIHDFHAVVGPPHHEEPVPTWDRDATLWWTAYCAWASSAGTGGGRDGDPHMFEAIFARDPESRRYLVLLQAEADELIEQWERLPQVERFPYDGSMALRTVGGETDQRLATWERALPEGVNFGDRTLRWDLGVTWGARSDVGPTPTDDIRAVLTDELAALSVEGRSLALAYTLTAMSHPIGDLIRSALRPDREAIMAEFRDTREISVLAAQIEPHLPSIDIATILGSTSVPVADPRRGRRLRTAAESIAETLAHIVHRVVLFDDEDDD